MSTKERYAVTRRLHTTHSDLSYSLAVFGDHLADREGYKELSGMEAVQFYLCHKFHWPPAQVKGMNSEDLRFLLTEDMHGWTMPEDARPVNHEVAEC